MGNILSVLIENSDMRICEIAKSGTAITVKNAFQVELPSGVVDDGIIVDVEAVAKVLYAALKNNNIKRGKIAFVITSRKIANKEVILPYVKNEAKIEEMIKANIETEIAPIVGTEQQAKDLIQYIGESGQRGESIWETNIFGKSIEQLVQDGIRSKLTSIGEESQSKLQDTMQKIVNDSKGGMVCIII